MNWVDIVLLVVFLLALWAGWHRGFLLGSLDLLSWGSSLALGYIFYPYLASGLDRFIDIGPWLLPLAFILTTLIARLLIGFIIRYIIRFIPDTVNHNPINKFLGLIPG